MEPNTNQNQIQNQNEPIQEDIVLPFVDRPYEEVEDGYIDDRGFYTTPNESFWDDDQTYFNHLGFDRYGGSYDKYGIYQPGPEYDVKTGFYKEQKELFNATEVIDDKNDKNTISRLREQEKKDEKIIQKYEELVEESEEEDDKSNITFDDEDIKEAYNDVMELEKNNNKINNNNINININCNNNTNKKHILDVKFTTSPNENNNNTLHDINTA